MAPVAGAPAGHVPEATFALDGEGAEGIRDLPADAAYTQRITAIDQFPELPTGCESVALTIVLDSMGYELEKTTIATEALETSEWDFVNAYVGDPTTYEGMGAYPPAIVAAANRFLEGRQADARAFDITGSSFEELRAFIDAGYPVLVWTTMYMDVPLYTDYGIDDWLWYENEHCVVLYGYNDDAETVSISDPLSGLGSYDSAWFRDIYEYCGSMAVVIH